MVQTSVSSVLQTCGSSTTGQAGTPLFLPGTRTVWIRTMDDRCHLTLHGLLTSCVRVGRWPWTSSFHRCGLTQLEKGRSPLVLRVSTCSVLSWGPVGGRVGQWLHSRGGRGQICVPSNDFTMIVTSPTLLRQPLAHAPARTPVAEGTQF